MSHGPVRSTFLKKAEPSRIKEDPEADTKEEKTDFILALEGKEIHRSLPP